MAQTQEYVIRTEGMANSFGLGEEVVPGVTLFRKGHYNLTRSELNSLIKAKSGSVVVRIKGK